MLFQCDLRAKHSTIRLLVMLTLLFLCTMNGHLGQHNMANLICLSFSLTSHSQPRVCHLAISYTVLRQWCAKTFLPRDHADPCPRFQAFAPPLPIPVSFLVQDRGMLCFGRKSIKGKICSNHPHIYHHNQQSKPRPESLFVGLSCPIFPL